jgi:hypothetical protein
MARTGVPRTRTPYLSRMPESSSSRPQLSAVWPPKESRIASTSSLTMTRSTKSGVTACQVDLVGEAFAGLDGGDVRVDEDGLDLLLRSALIAWLPE